jgi:hypothetical protein
MSIKYSDDDAVRADGFGVAVVSAAVALATVVIIGLVGLPGWPEADRTSGGELPAAAAIDPALRQG